MAEKVKEKAKKAETTPKTKKAAVKKNGAVANLTQMSAPQEKTKSHSHEEVAQLAHRFWAERGHRHGHHVEDWLRAEQELRGRAS